MKLTGWTAGCGKRIKMEPGCGMSEILMAGCGTKILKDESGLFILTGGMHVGYGMKSSKLQVKQT